MIVDRHGCGGGNELFVTGLKNLDILGIIPMYSVCGMGFHVFGVAIVMI